MIQNPGLEGGPDPDRYACRGCGIIVTDPEHASLLPIEIGDAGLPIHVGSCSSCIKSASGEAMADLMSEIRAQEIWQKIEDRIDLIVGAAKRGGAHRCSPPTGETEIGWSRHWSCSVCGQNWEKPPWYSAYQPVSG